MVLLSITSYTSFTKNYLIYVPYLFTYYFFRKTFNSLPLYSGFILRISWIAKTFVLFLRIIIHYLSRFLLYISFENLFIEILIFSNWRVTRIRKHTTLKSYIVNDEVCHLIIQGLINVKHVTWILVLKKILRNIEKKNIAVTVPVIVK
jgi:hypothetical protein